MRHLHIRAGRRCKAPTIFAETELFLLFAGRKAEIRRRPSHVAYVALEIRVVQKAFCFINYALLAPYGDGSALMKRK